MLNALTKSLSPDYAKLKPPRAARRHRCKLIGFHLPYPSIGIIEIKDGAYRFMSANSPFN